MKTTTNTDLMEKVKRLVFTLTVNGTYFNEMMESLFSDDPDLPVIREKMNNLSNLVKTKGMDNLLEMDFETEIWKLI